MRIWKMASAALLLVVGAATGVMLPCPFLGTLRVSLAKLHMPATVEEPYCTFDGDETPFGCGEHSTDCTDYDWGFKCACESGYYGPQCLTCLLQSCTGQAMSEAAVPTVNGAVVGLVDDDVRSFKGIPYAVPPVDDLRMQPPLPRQPTTDSIEAFEFAPACVQFNMFGRAFDLYSPYEPDDPEAQRGFWATSEDCLYLNVWAPKDDLEAPELGWPVLVYIHSGDNLVGHGGWVADQPRGIVQKGLIVVTFNYRLGPLGWFNANDTAMNVGLRDMMLALEWVGDNIGFFGGNAQMVTLAGDGRGAVNVHLLGLFAETKDLFQQCIQISGSWSQPNAFCDSTDSSDRLMNTVECGNTGCVAFGRSRREIEQAHDCMVNDNMQTNDWFSMLDFPWCADLNDETLFPGPSPDDLYLLLDEMDNKPCIVVGHQMEAAIFTASNFTLDLYDWGIRPADDMDADDLRAVMAVLLERALGQLGLSPEPVQLDAILQLGMHYATDPNGLRNGAPVGIVEAYSRMVSDVYYTIPLMVDLYNPGAAGLPDGRLSRNVKIWVGMLTYASEGLWHDDSSVKRATYTNLMRDFWHIKYVFGQDAGPDDLAWRAIWQKYLTSFIRHGDPSSKRDKKAPPKVSKWVASKTGSRIGINLKLPKPKKTKFFGKIPADIFFKYIPGILQLGEDEEELQDAVDAYKKLIDKSLKKAAKKYVP